MKTYYVKESWIFNLEAMHDKIWCMIYDIRDGKLACPFEACGKIITGEEDLEELLDESSELEWIAKSRKVTGKEYGRIKELVNWRVMQRYITCIANGMSESKAGVCFRDL